MTDDYVLLNALRSVDYATPFASDPRLVSAGHSGESIRFTVPPRDGHVSTVDVYDDWLTDVRASPYNSYADIIAGDVTYYFDRDIGRAFLSPLLYDGSDTITKENYVDPMGTLKPIYSMNPPKCCDATRLSWIRDSNFHRQDLMALQQWKRNQSEPLYYY